MNLATELSNHTLSNENYRPRIEYKNIVYFSHNTQEEILKRSSTKEWVDGILRRNIYFEEVKFRDVRKTAANRLVPSVD